MTEIFSKVANARLPVAGRGPTRLVTSLFKAASGGVWVGGKVVLSDIELSFSANKMNRLAQTGTLDVSIPVESITGAKITGGVATKIIEVDHGETTPFVFRCTGAKQILEQLHDTVHLNGSLS